MCCSFLHQDLPLRWTSSDPQEELYSYYNDHSDHVWELESDMNCCRAKEFKVYNENTKEKEKKVLLAIDSTVPCSRCGPQQAGSGFKFHAIWHRNVN